jgi:hypothetical protein
MDLRKHREEQGLSEKELAARVLEQMGVRPTAKNYKRKLRNMVEYVKRWEDLACRPSPKYMPHVIAVTTPEVAASFYQ